MNIDIFKIEKEEDYLKNKHIIDINSLNEKGQNALLNASLEKMKWLVENGINVNNIDKSGKNIIFSSKNVSLLSSYGVNINQIDNEGYSAFYNASREKIKLLVENGFDFDKHSDLTYLKYEQIKTLIIFISSEVLKKIKIDINALNRQKNNILFGINHLSDEKVEILIEKGCNVNHFNKENRNCTYQTDISKLKILIKHGAQIDYLDVYNKNLLFYTKDNELLKFILSHEFNNKNVKAKRTDKNALFNADLEKIKILFKNGFSKKDLNVQDRSEGKSILFFANEECTKFLIKMGIDVNLIDKEGNNALFEASFEKSKLLVAAGIDINLINKRNDTALWLANSKETEDLLIENGAKIPSKLVDDYQYRDKKRCNEMLVKIEKNHLMKRISSNDDSLLKKRL